MRAVMTPVATPRAKEPLKTPRKMPKDFNMAMASKLWLLSPAGWYATMELKDRQKRVQRTKTIYMKKGNRPLPRIQEGKLVKCYTHAQIKTET